MSECADCGAALMSVGGAAAHERWHKMIEDRAYLTYNALADAVFDLHKLVIRGDRSPR